LIVQTAASAMSFVILVLNKAVIFAPISGSSLFTHATLHFAMVGQSVRLGPCLVIFASAITYLGNGEEKLHAPEESCSSSLFCWSSRPPCELKEPDFSGIRRLNRDQSDYGDLQGLESRIDVIEQHEDHVQLVQSRSTAFRKTTVLDRRRYLHQGLIVSRAEGNK
jgi:hypothetical protein